MVSESNGQVTLYPHTMCLSHPRMVTLLSTTKILHVIILSYARWCYARSNSRTCHNLKPWIWSSLDPPYNEIFNTHAVHLSLNIDLEEKIVSPEDNILWRIQIECLPEDNDVFEECEEYKDDTSAHPNVQGWHIAHLIIIIIIIELINGQVDQWAGWAMG